MTMNSVNVTDLAEKVVGITQDIPYSNIQKLTSAWEYGIKVTKYNLEEITDMSGPKIRQLMLLVSDPAIDQSVLQAMFATCLVAKSHTSQNTNEMEIVWTGPGRINAGVRSTKPVIEEMLKSAKHGEKVIIIDYRITSNAESIVNELNTCLKTGVQIDLIIDKSRVNKNELRKCFAEKSLTKPTIYTRKDKESKFYKVHAKVIIIHDRQMLVSSANLTELGTEVNFELGLLVSGPIVKNMIALIMKMIDEEYFVGGNEK